MKKKTSERQIKIIAITIALCLSADSMLYITLPIYWKVIGLTSLWEVGIILSVNRLIRLPLNPITGWLYNKIPIQTGIWIAVVAAIISNVGYAVGKGIVIWIILRILWGFSWALFSIGGILNVINHSNENNRGQLIGMYNGLYRLGSLGGMLLGGLLPTLIGFHRTLLFFGLLSVLALPLVIFLKTKQHASEILQNNMKFFNKKLLIKPVLVVLASGLIINMLYRGFINSTLSLIIKQHFGPELFFYGIILSSTALAGVIQAARWSWEPILAFRVGKWSDGPKGRLPLFTVTLILASLSFILMPFYMPMLIWFVVIFLVMLCATSLTTLMDSLASDTAKHCNLTISVMTVYTVANDLGAALGPLIIYFLLSFKYGMFFACWIGALCLCAIMVMWHGKNEGDSKDWADFGNFTE